MIMSFNAEGISQAKIKILSNLKVDTLCLQETHKDKPPKIPGLDLIIYHGNMVHDTAIYARDKSIGFSSKDKSANSM